MINKPFPKTYGIFGIIFSNVFGRVRPVNLIFTHTPGKRYKGVLSFHQINLFIAGKLTLSSSENTPSFADLGLCPEILQAVTEKGYQTPTPVQAVAIPAILTGSDILGCAQTGTGKTAGFTLPVLQILKGSRRRVGMPRALILEPTRELALQVAENLIDYGKYLKLSHALLIGGESMNDQKNILTRGVDILIATPGRLIDLFERGGVLLTGIKILVIDEADRMLDMGFIPDVEKITSKIPNREQTLFFSATVTPAIRKPAELLLKNPQEIVVSRPSSVAGTVQAFAVATLPLRKRQVLRALLTSQNVQNALIFCNRKRDIDVLVRSLNRHGFQAGALHGDMAQSARFATLEKFKAGELTLLVCSDVAARGIDISGLSHVFNFDVPVNPEDYVHRIGRTGRANRTGSAFTLVTPKEEPQIKAVETLTGAKVPPFDLSGLFPEEMPEEAPALPAAESEESGKKDKNRHHRQKNSDEPSSFAGDSFAGRDENIVGFGEDIPAFMLIKIRPKAAFEASSETSSDPSAD